MDWCWSWLLPRLTIYVLFLAILLGSLFSFLSYRAEVSCKNGPNTFYSAGECYRNVEVQPLKAG